MSDVSGTVDGLYFGFVVSLILFGTTVSQSWTYLHTNTDKWPLRLYVLVLVLLSFAEICCSSTTVHHYLVENFGDITVLHRSVAAIQADFLLTGIIFFLVHLFFAHRLFLLSRSWWISGFIVLTSTAMLALNFHMTFAPEPKYNELVESRSTKLESELPAFHALAAATDVVVAVGFIWFLSKFKSEFKSTRKILQKMFVYSITRGLLITAVQIAHLVMFAVDPRNMLFWISLHLVLSKLYVTTMLVMLNSRSSIRESMENRVITDSLHFTGMGTSSNHHPDVAPRSPPPPPMNRAPTKTKTLPKLSLGHEIDIAEAGPRSAVSMTFSVHLPIAEGDSQV